MGSVPSAAVRYLERNRPAPPGGALRLSRRQWRRCGPARTWVRLTPEMRECRGRSVLRHTNTQLFADALAKLLIYGGNAGLAIQFQEIVFLRHDLKFALDHRLITHKRPVQIVRKGHVSSRFPVTDGLRLLEFARERCLRPDVQPERQIGTQRHGV